MPTTTPPATPTYDGTTIIPQPLADLLHEHFLTSDNDQIRRQTAAILAGEREHVVRRGTVAVLKLLLGDGLSAAIRAYRDRGLDGLDDDTRALLTNSTAILVQMAKDLGYTERVRCRGCGDVINVSHLCGYCGEDYRREREARGARVY